MISDHFDLQGRGEHIAPALYYYNYFPLLIFPIFAFPVLERGRRDEKFLYIFTVIIY